MSLDIRWPDGQRDSVPVGTTARVRAWVPLARELDLQLAAMVDDFLPIHGDNLDALTAELDALRAEMARRGGVWGYEAERVATIVAALRRLQQADGGWEACIG